MVKFTKVLLPWLNFAKWWSSIGEGPLQTGLPLLNIILTYFTAATGLTDQLQHVHQTAGTSGLM